MIDSIIRTAIDIERVQLAIDCFCNTRDASLEASSWIANTLIRAIQQHNNIWIVFHNLVRYLHRILDPKLEKFLDAAVALRPLWKIDWEILKSDLFLDIGMHKNELPRTYNLAETILNPQRLGNYSGLSGCPDAQNEVGYRLFEKLRDESCDNLLAQATDTSYSEILRAHILARIDFEDIDYVVEYLRVRGMLWGDFSEEYAWVVISFWRGRNVVEQEDQRAFIKHFWEEKSPYVQLRMLDLSRFMMSGTQDKQVLIRFLRDVVSSYKNAVPLNRLHLQYLADVYAGGSHHILILTMISHFCLI